MKDKDNRQRFSICLIDTHYFNYAKGQISWLKRHALSKEILREDTGVKAKTVLNLLNLKEAESLDVCTVGWTLEKSNK